MSLSGFSTPVERASTPLPEHAFRAPPSIHTCAGILFDMDGTLIDSTDAIVKHWNRIGEALGLDAKTILTTSHGRRSIDVFKQVAPEKATWEYISQLEALIPREFGQDAKEIPGARRLLASLDDLGAPWAIVTSGTRPLVEGWLSVMKLAHPKDLVVAEDVENGKPDPACYALGRSRLGFTEKADVLVIEDAPAGIRAGKAAGCKVIALTTTHSVQQVKGAGADWIVQDLQNVRIQGFDEKGGRVRIEIRNGFQG